MSFALSRHPITALEALETYLPRFVLQLEWPDIESYIIDGFVSRHFQIQGRFQQVGYTKAIYCIHDLTVDSLLNSRIPQHSVDLLYEGEATGGEFPRCRLSLSQLIDGLASFR